MAAALSTAFLLPGLALADEGLKLKPDSDLVDPHTYPAESAPFFGLAEHISGLTQDEVTLEGHAELRKQRMSIKADRIHYLQLEDEMLATGSVRLYQDGSVYTGPELRMRLDDDHGYFVAPNYAFGSSGSRGFADRINFFDHTHSELINAIYTTCPPGDYEWYLVADTMTMDQDTKEGESTNTVLYFEGVPILASPWLSFPLSADRKSGFLPPTFSLVSTNGAEFTLPYYWNIAPNRDLTIYPNFMSKRGVQLGENLRFLEPEQYGYIRFEGLEDHETGTFRYSESVLDYWNANSVLPGLSGFINLNKVSDSEYFNDFSRSFAAASTRTLPRDVEVTYGSSHWYTTLRTLTYQTLEQTDSVITPPYNKLPELLFHGAWLDYGGFDMVVDGDVTRFESPGMVGGERWVLNPSISYPIVGPGYFLTPRAEFNSTIYNLTDTSAGQPSTFARNLPAFSVDSGLIFERDANIFDTPYLQTLEPRLFYVYRPYRDQSALPNFDSALPDFNFSQLFSDNSFLGYDRLADENQLTAAVTSRFLNPESGGEILRAAIGQRFFLSPQRVTVPGGSPVNSGNSDFLALLEGQATPEVMVDTGIDYNPAAGGMERSNIGAHWNAGDNRELGFEYRYLRGQFDQYDVSGQWPLGGGFYGVGRVNYSSRDRTVVEGLAGLEYKGCCWVVRVVAQRYVTGLSSATTSIFIQLELNGFSDIGSNPFDALRRNVYGYEPVVVPSPVQSPFIRYE